MSQGDGNTAVKTKARIKRETKEIRAKENQRGSKVSHLTVEVLFILSNQCQGNQDETTTRCLKIIEKVLFNIASEASNVYNLN